MAIIYGISGSTILSDSKKFDKLISFNMNHIEIGEFASYEEAAMFFKKIKNKPFSHAIHSPFIRGKSKYSFIEKNDNTVDVAYNNLIDDAETAKKLNSKYLLVHFPYFKGPNDLDNDDIIEEGLHKLHKIQNKYGIEIICEPKIGNMRSPFGINCLNRFPLELWKKYSLGLCIDVGDYVLADYSNAVNYVSKWKDYIKVVHLHNVEIIGDKYYWRPIHPEMEKKSEFKIKPLLEYLMNLDSVYFILEHTPHGGFDKKYVLEGFSWLKEIKRTIS